MTQVALSSPPATARLVVTLPPEPSRLGRALNDDFASNYITLTPTTDAFRHVALLAVDRLTIMVPYIDKVGAEWAMEVFDCSPASEKVLIIRGADQLRGCGNAGERLGNAVSRVIDYGGGDLANETFHAKIVLADGRAAYVGSANLLRRSKLANLECGMLIEGAAVHAVKVLLDAVVACCSSSEKP